MQSGRILAVLDAALRDQGIRPQQIWLEATERGFRDLQAVQRILSQARAHRYVVAIDDFGTGYSSLSCLEDFSLDILKIDKSFIVGNAGQGKIVGHIIAMAKSLGLKIVAEGVETPAQATWLKAAGVEYGQGWLYAKAMPAAELKAFLKNSDTTTTNCLESIDGLLKCS